MERFSGHGVIRLQLHLKRLAALLLLHKQDARLHHLAPEQLLVGLQPPQGRVHVMHEHGSNGRKAQGRFFLLCSFSMGHVWDKYNNR